MNWISIQKSKPLAYKTGCWEGKKSDPILVCTIGGKYHVVEMYEGILDGNEFLDFYDDRDFEIKNVFLWSEINNPF